MGDSCVFCKIASGEIPAEKLYENETALAFRDINPVAKTHVLVIPKAHCDNIMGLSDPAVAGELHLAIQEAARAAGVDESGFRLIVNCGSDGAQTVNHLHYHIIGGQPLGVRLL